MDWLRDDGINLSMINDHVRNRFYHDMIKSVVAGRSCIDVGFGTGLLTMMALDHGAAHVTAYEVDHGRYNLGLDTIKKCGIEDQVTLLNKKYDHAQRRDPKDLLFHEIIHANIWDEGLWHCLPRHPDSNFFPQCYQIEIRALSLPEWSDRPRFDPGVEVNAQFCDILNQLVSQNVRHNHVHQFLSDRADWMYIKFMEQQMLGTFLAGYRLNVDTCSIDLLAPDGIVRNTPINFDEEWISFDVDLPARSLIVWRAAIGYHGKILRLMDTMDWDGKVDDPYVNINQRRMSFNHNFINGRIRFFPLDNLMESHNGNL